MSVFNERTIAGPFPAAADDFGAHIKTKNNEPNACRNEEKRAPCRRKSQKREGEHQNSDRNY